MLYPTSFLKGKGLGQGLRAHHRRALLAAARRGLSIGHVSPEAGEGGAIGLVEEGDRIRDRHPRAPHRRGLGRRRARSAAAPMAARGADAWRPNRDRTVSSRSAGLRAHDDQRRPRRRPRPVTSFSAAGVKSRFRGGRFRPISLRHDLRHGRRCGHAAGLVGCPWQRGPEPLVDARRAAPPAADDGRHGSSAKSRSPSTPARPAAKRTGSIGRSWRS